MREIDLLLLEELTMMHHSGSDCFIEAPGIGLELPLDVRGTAFQQRVWQALQEIPVGKTVCYAEIARRRVPATSACAVFHRDMLYGDVPEFEMAVRTFTTLAQHLQRGRA
jgi:6-O-methylguanine DNA methyltransferase-like protein